MSDGTMYAGRIQDTASENFGPFPVQTDEEAMTAIERGIFEQRQALAAALADAAALRESVTAMEATDRVREYTIRSVSTQRDEARALAITNGEARGRAEAKANKLRADLTRMDCDWPDFEAMRAERDELRGLLVSATEHLEAALEAFGSDLDKEEAGDEQRFIDELRAWLAAHPAIPEGTPPLNSSETPNGSAEGTPTAKLGCAACGCALEKHAPECSDCGCWGFFRAGAKRCDNPRCEGSACAGETAEHDHGPNDVAPEGPIPSRVTATTEGKET